MSAVKPPENPVASLLRRAAEGIRAAVAAVQQGAWEGRPWAVENCSEHECPCIVHQGEYKPWNEAQVPPIQYVADAETPEHAAYIASMHPGVGLALAGWLEDEAERARLSMGHFDGKDCCDGQECVHRHAPGWWHDGGEDAEWSCNDPWTGGEDGCMCFAGAVATARAWLGETGEPR